MRKLFLGIVLTLFSAGCVGRNFVRPTTSIYPLGKTRYDSITKDYGSPDKARRIVLRNGNMIRRVPYFYVSPGSAFVFSFGFGSIVAKSVDFYFDKDDILIGFDYASSFPSDSTDIKEADVQNIKNGQTTCKQVSDLLGPFGGEYLYPMVGEPGDRAITYYYSQMKRGVFQEHNADKSLIVTCSSSDVVKDVHYSYFGDR